MPSRHLELDASCESSCDVTASMSAVSSAAEAAGNNPPFKNSLLCPPLSASDVTIDPDVVYAANGIFLTSQQQENTPPPIKKFDFRSRPFFGTAPSVTESSGTIKCTPSSNYFSYFLC